MPDTTSGDVVIPSVSEGTQAAISNLVEYAIHREYGRTEVDGHSIADLSRGARMIAVAGLQLDLRTWFLARPGGSDARLRGFAESHLQVLVNQELKTRECQCGKLYPSCPHSHSLSIVCHSHYESDVPPINGALLCGTCHGAEYRARQEHH